MWSVRQGIFVLGGKKYENKEKKQSQSRNCQRLLRDCEECYWIDCSANNIHKELRELIP